MNKPAIIFIDECDCVFSDRAKDDATDSSTSIRNQLLVEMDGEYTDWNILKYDMLLPSDGFSHSSYLAAPISLHTETIHPGSAEEPENPGFLLMFRTWYL